jgi:hypothetical protein
MPMASRAQDDRAAEACLEGLTISGPRRRPERVKILLLEFLEEVNVAALRCEGVRAFAASTSPGPATNVSRRTVPSRTGGSASREDGVALHPVPKVHDLPARPGEHGVVKRAILTKVGLRWLLWLPLDADEVQQPMRTLDSRVLRPNSADKMLIVVLRARLQMPPKHYATKRSVRSADAARSDSCSRCVNTVSSRCSSPR